jgi:hypothetical protein
MVRGSFLPAGHLKPGRMAVPVLVGLVRVPKRSSPTTPRSAGPEEMANFLGQPYNRDVAEDATVKVIRFAYSARPSVAVAAS